MLVRDIEVIPAIIDLVDNSADGAKRLRSEPSETRYNGLWVDIQISPERFVIHDNCGGMDVDLARDYAFRFGRVHDKMGPVGEVGQFGIGMKRSLFKLGQKFTVESATAKSRFSLPVVVPKWMDEPAADWSFRFDRLEEKIKVPAGKRGTKIVVEDLHDLIKEDFGQTRFINRLRRDIAVRELRLLQQGLEIRVNGAPLAASAPILLASKNLSPIHIERDLTVNGSTLNLQLWAGLAESAGDDDDVDDAEKYRQEAPAGWYLFCNDRLLLYADKGRLTGWGNEAAAYHPQYGRFRGYVLLEGDARFMPWNTTKTGVDEDSRVFREVQNDMFDALQKVQAVINRLKKERRQTDPASRPAVMALERAKPVSLFEVPESSSFQIPDPAPDLPPTAQWIRYQVDLEDFELVAESIGSGTPADVGRATFEWYLEEQVD